MTMQYLGLDTSNYTTSAALYTPASGDMASARRLLPVKDGQLGLRQSDAVFHHTAALPDILDALPAYRDVRAVGVSARPRDADGSYMPCFLAGVSAAHSAAKALNVPLYTFSHQAGHIGAAIFSSGREDLLHKPFLAFHVSGGTTEVVRVTPDACKVIATETVLHSLDLKAGQAVDRVGVMLGYPFPAGRYVDALCCESAREFKIRVPLRDGCCSLSGVQNQCERMHRSGESDADVCRYCLSYIAQALCSMAEYACEQFGQTELVFSGGVMCSRYLRDTLSRRFPCVFAAPEYSGDNAAGIAYLTSKMKP